MSIQDYYNKTVKIYRYSKEIVYPHGKTWSLLNEIEGLKDLLSSREIIRDEGGRVLADYKLYIDVIDVIEADVVEIDSLWYDIYSIHNPNEMDRHLELKIKKLEEDPR